MGDFLLRLIAGWGVSLILWKSARPYGRVVGRGSAGGITGGAVAGAVVGMLSVIRPDWESRADPNYLTGPGLIVGALAGALAGDRFRETERLRLGPDMAVTYERHRT